MTLNKIHLYVLLFALSIILLAVCYNSQAGDVSFFPGVYPAEAEGYISGNRLSLTNQALEVEWSTGNNTIQLKRLTNKYDGQTVDLSNVNLFAIELGNGQQLTNHDFFIQNRPILGNIAATDSLPTAALHFAGKEISVLLAEKNGNLTVKWTAQLRDGSNYIRQNIEIKAAKKPVKIRQVTFFDGVLEGAEYAGLVLGSPIQYKNFFFGLEHPIAHSKALLTRNIGTVNRKSIDVSGIIDTPGEYIVSVEHGGGPANYNIKSVALFENGKQIAIDNHPLNGTGGNSFYRLKLKDYDASGSYVIKPEIINPSNATGLFHIHRKTNGILNFYVKRSDVLRPGNVISEWAVMGVSPENQNRRAFLYYLERERARPYKQFLHYNCWWDITEDGASSFTSEQLIERMHAWNEKFIQPYDIELNSFVFDDGWDDLDSVWYFDPVKFPDGFKPQAELCKKYNSGIGVWMSPFGGYLENKRRRIESARREGLETNAGGLSLAGANYYKRFLERSLDMLDNYHVNYFKYDGFGGSNPEYLPDMEAGIRLIKTLRRHNPDVYINITVGSWPSPFWLLYADCTWRGSGDLHMAGEGSRTQRFMTYRDGTLYNNVVKKAPYYPLNSIMTVGIAYANLGLPAKCINDSISDFSDMVWSSFGDGSSLQELYISHDRMKPEFWPILAKAAKWAKENENVLKDTHWIGGSPINLEVYGFASWTPEKGIIVLRNPSSQTKLFKNSLDEIFKLPSGFAGEYLLVPVYGNDSVSITLENAVNFEISLKPFETRIYEVAKDN
ncbi:MAG: hypothetical protein J7K46_07550 [Bacteroidales bacterium]|nr:hypothetical protein [Bacteroidales bacterium]